MTDLLAALFAEHYRALVRMLYRRTGDVDRAEDIAQETFARAARESPRSARSWLYAVALNLLRDEARKDVRRDRRLVLVEAETAAAHAPAPDEAMERSEREARVRAALDRLSARDREVLLLQAEGLDYDEIAAATGLSRGAIGTTLSRARRRFVAVYDGEEATDVA
jgi:RNA polymerase sigma-70 factor (ECF subfamily)